MGMGRDAKAFEVSRDSWELRAPGAYAFMVDHKTGERMGIQHSCPCGCGMQSAMWFRDKAISRDHEWDVVGEWPNVTLSPSIGIARGAGPNGGFHWHGYLENGVWVER